MRIEDFQLCHWGWITRLSYLPLMWGPATLTVSLAGSYHLLPALRLTRFVASFCAVMNNEELISQRERVCIAPVCPPVWQPISSMAYQLAQRTPGNVHRLQISPVWKRIIPTLEKLKVILSLQTLHAYVKGAFWQEGVWSTGPFYAGCLKYILKLICFWIRILDRKSVV